MCHTPLIRLCAFFIRLNTLSIRLSYGATRCPYVCHTVERVAHTTIVSKHDCHTPEHVCHTPEHDVHTTPILFLVKLHLKKGCSGTDKEEVKIKLDFIKRNIVTYCFYSDAHFSIVFPPKIVLLNPQFSQQIIHYQRFPLKITP